MKKEEKLRDIIIEEGIRKGLSVNEILKRLQKREVGIRRSVGLREIKNGGENN